MSSQKQVQLYTNTIIKQEHFTKSINVNQVHRVNITKHTRTFTRKKNGMPIKVLSSYGLEGETYTVSLYAQ